MLENDGGKIVFKPVGHIFDGAAAAHFPSKPSRGEQRDKGLAYVIAIVLPFMARGHVRMPQAGENIFIDSTFNTTNNTDDKLAAVLAQTPSGGFPLAFIITNVNSTPGYAAALEVVKEALPGDKAFFYRGVRRGERS